MNFRSPTVSFAGVIAAAGALWISCSQRAGNGNRSDPATKAVETMGAQINRTNQSPGSSVDVSSTSNSRSNQANAGGADEVMKKYRGRLIDKDQAMSEILSTENDVPIVFYGKLEDQFGNAIADAEITGTTTIYNGVTEGTGRYTTMSDANGYFKLDAGKGESLGVMPRKSGYAVASLNTGGFYTRLKPENERQHPDPNNPVVIKMWKMQGAEPLAKINCQLKIPYTNTPIHVDLLTGKIVSTDGDVEITVTRSPGFLSSQNRLDWNIKIAAVEGGLMDSSGTERITYFAPENGYDPSKTIYSSDRLPQSGLSGFRAGLYVKSRNGQVYSKIGFSFGINMKPDDPIYIEFKGVANTNGSRNWEGDPNTYKP